jgi:hypothetical protein
MNSGLGVAIVAPFQARIPPFFLFFLAAFEDVVIGVREDIKGIFSD